MEIENIKKIELVSEREWKDVYEVILEDEKGNQYALVSQEASERYKPEQWETWKKFGAREIPEEKRKVLGILSSDVELIVENPESVKEVLEDTEHKSIINPKGVFGCKLEKKDDQIHKIICKPKINNKY